MRRREFLGVSESAGHLGADWPHPVWAISAQGSVASDLYPRGALPRALPPTLHPSRKAVWGVSRPMCLSPQVWKGYLQRKRTQQDRRTEMEFIGMVSIPPPALCTPPSTEDWGRGVWGPWWKVSRKPLPSHVPSRCHPPSQSPLEGSHTWGGERDGGSGHPVPWPMMELAGEAAGGGPRSGTRPVPRASGFPAASVRSTWGAQLG